MTRRCSHCGNNGHNSRTCPDRGVKIFGVRFDGGGSIRKSQSMGNLSHYAGGSGGGSPAVGDAGDEKEKDGYVSEDFVKGSSSSCTDRKKGVAWTEEEHKMFLLGLQKLGKGDWRGISRKYVVSRTATQVASHAQKFFIRQTNANRRKRRTSLFDMVPDEIGESLILPIGSQEPDAHSGNPVLQNSNPVLAPSSLEAEYGPSNSNSNNPVAVAPPPPPPPLPPVNVQPYPIDIESAVMKLGAVPYPYPVMCPPCPPFFPFSYPFWPCYRADAVMGKAQTVAKPTAQHSTTPVNVDQLVGMSKLNIGESVGASASPAPLNLLGGPERHSAFHASIPPASSSTTNPGSSPIHAV